MSKKRVIVGMSGGVDSSVTALLLKQQGYDVQGVFMKNWEEDDTLAECPAKVDIEAVTAVCQVIGIDFQTVNFSREYWDRVFAHFLQEYQAGRTPNPDILCNKEIKFKAFHHYAQSLGADFIATGHYARCDQNGTFRLLKGSDSNKDQSYFLYTLGQTELERALFPIGHLTKPVVRQIAVEAGLPNHARKDSTGICFIGERHFKNFLAHYLPAQPGNIETFEGEIIGTHDGLMYHTIGQRQGLRIGGRKGAKEEPWYVLKKDLARNVLIVGQGHDHPLLFKTSLICRDIHWVARQNPTLPMHCFAKTRYRQTEQACVIHVLDDNKLEVTFIEPQWAITPGQAIVFYQDDVCLGGATIEE